MTSFRTGGGPWILPEDARDRRVAVLAACPPSARLSLEFLVRR